MSTSVSFVLSVFSTLNVSPAPSIATGILHFYDFFLNSMSVEKLPMTVQKYSQPPSLLVMASSIICLSPVDLKLYEGRDIFFSVLIPTVSLIP